MTSIIQRRRNLLAPPFTTNRPATQLCCKITIMAAIFHTSVFCERLSVKTRVVTETLRPDSKNELRVKTSNEPLLALNISRLTLLHQTVLAEPLLDFRIAKCSQLDIKTSSENRLNMSADGKSSLKLSTTVLPEVFFNTQKTPCLNLTVARPVCKE